MPLPTKRKVAACTAIILALVAAPAPLLPALRLAEAVQAISSLPWKVAYLAAAIGLQVAFYASIGVLAAFAVDRAPTLWGRCVQITAIPIVVVGAALLIRSLKAGHWPVWINAFVPSLACLFGVAIGLAVLYRHALLIPLVSAVVVVGALWGLRSFTSSALRQATEAHLRRLVAAGEALPAGDARFGALLQTAFVPLPGEGTAVQDNRAAILAWGIAVGHPGVATLVGLDPHGELVSRAAALASGTTLRGRADWPRHYAVSAALAVLEYPLVSDAGGLMKEQLDALAGDSGFSFGDLAADRAGVRFAVAATSSEAAAKAMQQRLQRPFAVEEFFPSISFPENLSVAEFRRQFGSVGSQRYRLEVSRIEVGLDGCAALSTPP